VTVCCSEIHVCFNQPEQFILALVEVEDDDQAHDPRYVRRPFEKEPDSLAISVNYDLEELLARSEIPASVLFCQEKLGEKHSCLIILTVSNRLIKV
jgi:hypothetical protein